MSQPSLIRLQFNNWRSLRDVEIEFDTPITVFIGANSSGKTNIVDGLRFLQSTSANGILESIFAWKGFNNLRTFGVDDGVYIGTTFKTNDEADELGYGLEFTFDNESPLNFSLIEQLTIDGETIPSRFEGGDVPRGLLLNSGNNYLERSASREIKRRGNVIRKILQMIQKWQFIAQDFSPSLHTPTEFTSDINRLSSDGANLPYVLDFMRQFRPQKFADLVTDARWMLDHVEGLETDRTDREIRLRVREKAHPEREAATISGGTMRVIGMLTPFYLLDFYPKVGDFDAPGLVVIEEPDTALNPGILARFVGQLREYTREKPRQIILTTHNPTFLNYFEPEEVRVVTRDERGYTQVNRIPDHVRDIWLDEYALGEVWMTNSLGGLAL